MITFIRIIAMGNVGLVQMKILPFFLVRNQISTNNNIKERCLFGGGCYMFTIFFRAGLLLLLMFWGELIEQIVVPRGPPAELNDSSLQPSKCFVTNLRKNICRAVQDGVTPRWPSAAPEGADAKAHSRIVCLITWHDQHNSSSCPSSSSLSSFTQPTISMSLVLFKASFFSCQWCFVCGPWCSGVLSTILLKQMQ